MGSVLAHFAGWRAVHAVLALNGGRSLGGASQRAARPGFADDEHGAPRLLDDTKSAGCAVAKALSYACIFAYIAGSPLVVMGQMGLSPGVFAGVFARAHRL